MNLEPRLCKSATFILWNIKVQPWNSHTIVSTSRYSDSFKIHSNKLPSPFSYSYRSFSTLLMFFIPLFVPNLYRAIFLQVHLSGTRMNWMKLNLTINFGFEMSWIAHYWLIPYLLLSLVLPIPNLSPLISMFLISSRFRHHSSSHFFPRENSLNSRHFSAKRHSRAECREKHFDTHKIWQSDNKYFKNGWKTKATNWNHA